MTDPFSSGKPGSYKAKWRSRAGEHGVQEEGKGGEKKERHRRVTRKLGNSPHRHEISYLQLKALRFLADEK